MSDEKVVKNLAIKIANMYFQSDSPIVVMCIGSDKIVGDMLGAVVGERLLNKGLSNIHVYGCLNYPITQKNIQAIHKQIQENHPKSKVLVIDSLLGDVEEVGQVKMSKSGVYAGAEFGDGTYVGDQSILGIVSPKGINALTFLSSVKIGMIKKMSDIIVGAFVLAERYKMELC